MTDKDFMRAVAGLLRLVETHSELKERLPLKLRKQAE